MSFTQGTLKERQAVAFVTTTTLNASSVSTGALNMAIVRRARAFLVCGTLTSTASVDFSLVASATAGGSFTAITAGLTTLPAVTGIVTDDSLNAIEITADLMPAGKPFLKALATETATQNAVVTVILVGDDVGYQPGSDYNTATFTNNVVAKV